MYRGLHNANESVMSICLLLQMARNTTLQHLDIPNWWLVSFAPSNVDCWPFSLIQFKVRRTSLTAQYLWFSSSDHVWHNPSKWSLDSPTIQPCLQCRGTGPRQVHACTTRVASKGNATTTIQSLWSFTTEHAKLLILTVNLLARANGIGMDLVMSLTTHSHVTESFGPNKLVSHVFRYKLGKFAYRSFCFFLKDYRS